MFVFFLIVIKATAFAGTPDCNLGFQTTEALIESDLSDVREFLEKKVQVKDQPYMRFFEIPFKFRSHSDKIQDLYLSLSKILNSLSWNSKLVLPKPVNASKTIFALDIRQLNNVDLGKRNWSRNRWQQFFNSKSYPYQNRTPSDDFKKIKQIVKSAVPILRLDWFVTIASVAPFYYDLLGIPSGFNSITKFAKFLEADQKPRIHAGDSHLVNRIGVTNAGPSSSEKDRVIQSNGIGRYVGPNGKKGNLWSTFDFASDTRRKDSDIFRSPTSELAEDPIFNDNFEFAHDGGEYIFTLPNGMLGFMVADALIGRRLNFAPIDLVVDRNRLGTNAYNLSENLYDGNDSITSPRRIQGGLAAVVTGLSCMGCHRSGLIHAEDEMLKYFEQREDDGFNEYVKSLYDGSQMQKDIDSDNAVYQRSLHQLGVKNPRQDFLGRVVREHLSPMSFADLADEMTMSAESLRELIDFHGEEADLDLEMMRLGPNGADTPRRFSREEVQDNFQALLRMKYRQSQKQLYDD